MPDDTKQTARDATDIRQWEPASQCEVDELRHALSGLVPSLSRWDDRVRVMTTLRKLIARIDADARKIEAAREALEMTLARIGRDQTGAIESANAALALLRGERTMP